MNSRIAWLPAALCAVLVLLLLGPALDPSLQLYYRDTLRCAYHFKQFISDQLHAGRAPFWDPWTESGTSVLVQITPGLFHPLTLLYLVSPFELAFKLNHLLAVPLAAAGLYLLARRTGASPWGAAAGACGYAGCGYVLSVVSSNLHYALGAATMPLALDALLFCAGWKTSDTFFGRPLRLLWAGYALALCFYGGEPQSMLLAGLIGAVWLIAPALLARRNVLRPIALVAAWGAVALALSAPAILPVAARLKNSVRVGGPPNRHDAESFANAPVRLLGVLLPWAFDDTQEATTSRGTPHYTEFFSGVQEDAFIDSIVLGAPILLLALWSRRKWPLVAALVFLLASTGSALHVLPLLNLLVPGLKLFRYAEKLTAPAAMLLCLAAAWGATRLEEEPEARALTLGAAALAAVLVLASLVVRLEHDALFSWLRAHGRTHSEVPARDFLAALETALGFEALAATLVALNAWLRARRPTFHAGAFAAVLCAVVSAVQGTGRILTIPLELVHAPLLLAEELKGRAGPSEGRWRIRGDSEHIPVFTGFDLRVGRMQGAMQALDPQFHALADVESISEYSSVGDRDYDAALIFSPAAMNEVLGVRFDLRSSSSLTAAHAAADGYTQAAFGTWVKEFPERRRAFLARCAHPAPALQTAVDFLRSRAFRIDEAVLRIDPGLPCTTAGTAGTVTLERPASNELRAHTNAPAPNVLIVAEHWDPGWTATIDGAKAQVVQADLAAMGVVVPAGAHEVVLRFFPHLLWLGVALCAACVALLVLLHFTVRKSRNSAHPA